MNSDGFITRWLDAVLRTPPQTPVPQEPGVQVIQPAPAFANYRLCYWAAGHLMFLIVLSAVFLGPMLGLWLADSSGIGGLIAELPRVYQRMTQSDGSAVRRVAAIFTLLFAFGVILGVVTAVLRLVFGFFLVRLDACRRQYILGERTLTVREGLTRVREMTFTYANIQDVRLTAGPLSRAFGIAHVTVETAGGGGGGANSHEHKQPGSQMHKATLQGLANASEVRDALLDRQRRCRVPGKGDAMPAGESAPSAAAVSAGLLHELTLEAVALRRAAETLAR